MAISTLDGLIAAGRQSLTIAKTAAVTAATAPNNMTAVWHAAGAPGAGTLAVGQTTTGVVVTDAVAGFPVINAFGGSALGYISGLQFSNSVASTIVLYDRLWHGGAYSFVTTYGQTTASWSSRVPGGTDYTGCELWFEQVTAGTGVQNVAVTYTNESGTGSKATGTVAAPAAMIVGRCFQMPLAAGDTGISAISNVVGSVASAGTYNLFVMRRLATMRVPVANFSDQWGWDRTGLPQIWADSALTIMVLPDSTSSGLPAVNVTISYA
jgi:hypothetical protein